MASQSFHDRQLLPAMANRLALQAGLRALFGNLLQPRPPLCPHELTPANGRPPGASVVTMPAPATPWGGRMRRWQGAGRVQPFPASRVRVSRPTRSPVAAPIARFASSHHHLVFSECHLKSPRALGGRGFRQGSLPHFCYTRLGDCQAAFLSALVCSAGQVGVLGFLCPG